MKIEVDHVFQYRVSLNSYLDTIDVPVYTNIDFMEQYGDEPYETSMPKCEQCIEDIVFTKAKINELKKALCKKIMEAENPFDIYCTDWDGGYLVEESDLLEHKLTLKEKFEIEKKTGTVFDDKPY
jgi:hypothetical protein